MKNRNPMFNQSGCKDLTAYEAIENVTKEERLELRYKKFMRTLFSFCELAGFRIEGRFTVVHTKTGKRWE